MCSTVVLASFRLPHGIVLVADCVQIVTESSAAPILDGTERCGLAYDHRHMCRFESRTSPGYKVVVAALMRYSEDARAIIAQRWLNNDATLSSMRAGEAAELFQTTDPRPVVDAGEKPH